MEIEKTSKNNQIDTDSAVIFPAGIAGFEQYRNYRLLQSDTEKELFFLQCIDEPAIEFSVTDPTTLKVSYEFTLDDDEARLIKADDNSEMALLVMLIKPDSGEQPGLQANFLGPLVINVEQRLGLQKVLNQKDAGVSVSIKG